MKASLQIVGLVLLIFTAGVATPAVGNPELPVRHEARFVPTQLDQEKTPDVPVKSPDGAGPCLSEPAPSAVDSQTVVETSNQIIRCQPQAVAMVKPVPSEDSSKAPAKPRLTFGWDNQRFVLRRSENGFQAFLNGYVQFDWHSNPSDPNSFRVRRARLGVDGRLRPNLEFKVQFDLADPQLVQLRDAYVKLSLPHKFQLWAGHLKAPFSQEQLHSDSAGDFVENSLISNLTTYRSPGIILSGESAAGRVKYDLGLFNGMGQFTRSKDESPEAFFRLRLSPWQNSGATRFKKLVFGGALSHSVADRAGQSVRGRSESRSFTFFKPETVNGSVSRANAELTWLLGPASFRAEYDQTNQERAGLGLLGANLPGVVARGYAAQFTYLLTGETKVDSKVVTPRNPFLQTEDGARGFGAWELKLRYANLQISDSTARSNRADSFYFGPNWYLNKHVRYVLDFGFERFKDPLRTPVAGEGNTFVILSRIQLTL